MPGPTILLVVAAAPRNLGLYRLYPAVADGEKGMLAVGVASPPDNIDKQSSSPPSDLCRINWGCCPPPPSSPPIIPNRDGARKLEGYPQGLGPESLLSKDLCRVILPRGLEDIDEGYIPKGGGRGL